VQFFLLSVFQNIITVTSTIFNIDNNIFFSCASNWNNMFW